MEVCRKRTNLCIPGPDVGSSVDCEGQVSRINYNNATRDSVLDLPLEQVQEFYRALKAYVDIMNRPTNVVTYRMEPGQGAPLYDEKISITLT
jgi:alpha-ketoglutarate-dependent taurine dioxygenase